MSSMSTNSDKMLEHFSSNDGAIYRVDAMAALGLEGGRLSLKLAAP